MHPRRRLVREQVEEFLPGLMERLPLLNDVLSLGLPDNDLTASLDPQVRHESLTSLLLALLAGGSTLALVDPMETPVLLLNAGRSSWIPGMLYTFCGALTALAREDKPRVSIGLPQVDMSSSGNVQSACCPPRTPRSR